MRTIITMLVTAVAVVSAEADNRHDQRLEQAVADIVATKIGEIRGGFDHDETPVIFSGDAYRSQHDAIPHPAPGREDPAWHDGLAPARGVPAYRRGNI